MLDGVEFSSETGKLAIVHLLSVNIVMHRVGKFAVCSCLLKTVAAFENSGTYITSASVQTSQ